MNFRTAIGEGWAMNDEAAFMAAILAAPDDDAPRLVFADWLDERGDRRAEWLRLTVRRDQLTRGPSAGEDMVARTLAWAKDRTEVGRITRRLQQLAAVVPEAWALRLHRGAIENCLNSETCPRFWHRLPESDQADQRPCHQCQRPVECCRTTWEAVKAGFRGRPVVQVPVRNPGVPLWENRSNAPPEEGSA
jgi:uncharacterized protein (TIGR02996 family)